jgi:hypothetical protein
LKQRIGIAPAGFRNPGGFNDGLTDRPDLQSMLQKMGYKWVSSKYPAHPLGTVGRPPDRKVILAIVAAQAQYSSSPSSSYDARLTEMRH